MSTNHNISEEKGEPKRYRTEVLPLTSLTPYRQAQTGSHALSLRLFCFSTGCSSSSHQFGSSFTVRWSSSPEFGFQVLEPWIWFSGPRTMNLIFNPESGYVNRMVKSFLIWYACNYTATSVMQWAENTIIVLPARVATWNVLTGYLFVATDFVPPF